MIDVYLTKPNADGCHLGQNDMNNNKARRKTIGNKNIRNYLS